MKSDPNSIGMDQALFEAAPTRPTASIDISLSPGDVEWLDNGADRTRVRGMG